jgi:hypothetical protein
MSPNLTSLTKIREGDELLREARRLNPHVRLPTLSDLERILLMGKPTEKKTGRPQGVEPTVTIALRVPESMCHQLDAYVERLEAQTGLKASRTAVCRHALRLYLEGQAPVSEPKTPAPKRPRRAAKAARATKG